MLERHSGQHVTGTSCRVPTSVGLRRAGRLPLFQDGRSCHTAAIMPGFSVGALAARGDSNSQFLFRSRLMTCEPVACHACQHPRVASCMVPSSGQSCRVSRNSDLLCRWAWRAALVWQHLHTFATPKQASFTMC